MTIGHRAYPTRHPERRKVRPPSSSGWRRSPQGLGGPERIPLDQLPIALAWAYFSWLVPGTLVWVVGTRILSHEAELPRVLRCVGFATAAQVLWLIGVVAPGAGSTSFHLALGVLIFGLALLANIIGIRQAFATGTLQAVQTFVLGFLAFAGVALLIGFVFAQLNTEV